MMSQIFSWIHKSDFANLISQTDFTNHLMISQNDFTTDSQNDFTNLPMISQNDFTHDSQNDFTDLLMISQNDFTK